VDSGCPLSSDVCRPSTFDVYTLETTFVRRFICNLVRISVCNKPYHMNNGFQQKCAEIKSLWNHALFFIVTLVLSQNHFFLPI